MFVPQVTSSAAEGAGAWFRRGAQPVPAYHRHTADVSSLDGCHFPRGDARFTSKGKVSKANSSRQKTDRKAPHQS